VSVEARSRRWCGAPGPQAPSLRVALALAGCVLTAGCQKEDRAPYAAPCETDCKPTIGIAIGSGSGTVTTPVTDAGFDAGTLGGSVLLLADQTFARATTYTKSATVTADGSSGTSVSAAWDGVNPYALTGVAVVPTNWISVSPNAAQGDELVTLQSVQTNATDSADLSVVEASVIDEILTAVSAPSRGPALGQVVLFFRNAGTGAALSGVRAVMTASEAPAYAAASGWVLQDDTTTTNSSGLVVFGNVELPPAGSTTQVVTVSRPASATMPAVSGGQFSVKVVEGAVTLASVAVQL
jgi:hypothetical protein